jgi:hypothetical protein
LSNLVAWYKPETLAASYANGDPISTWTDSSGNSLDLTGTTTARPLAAANSINGYMAASFDGSNDILSSGAYTVADKTYLAIVLNIARNYNYNGVICIDGATPPAQEPKFFFTYGYSTASWVTANKDPALQYFTWSGGKPGVPVATTDSILVTSVNVDGFLMRTNGTTCFVPANGSTATGTGYIHVGNVGVSGSTLNGDIAEVAIWEDTSDKSISWVEGYLAYKYGITLPNGHLFKNDPPSSAPPTYNSSGGLLRVNLNGGM